MNLKTSQPFVLDALEVKLAANLPVRQRKRHLVIMDGEAVVPDAQEKRLRKLFASARIMLDALREIDSSLTGTLPITSEVKAIARKAIKAAEGKA